MIQAFVQQVPIVVNKLQTNGLRLFFFRSDCALRDDAYAKNCLNTRMNVERLAQSIRQLIIDTKV